MNPQGIRRAWLALAAMAVAALSSTAFGECPGGTYQVGEQREESRSGNTITITVHPLCRRLRTAYADNPAAEALVQQMLTYARAQGWSDDDMRRVDAILHNLDLAPARPVPDSAVSSETWRVARARGVDRALADAAANGSGSSLFSSGWQNNRFADCALFALATASGTPYGVQTARAGELLRDATWRPADVRADPMSVFDGRGGLAGGEVVLLAESAGRAELVPPGMFEASLRDGRPVMIGVSVGSARHEVVLSRTFQHGGETWFEVIDSLTNNPGQRVFMTESELNGIIRENGVSYRPEPNTTPSLLR